jgi:hypothetical protein
MKKISVLIAWVILFPIGFTACVEAGDFDTGKISLNDLHPTYLIPLIQDTITLDGQPAISHDGDISVIFYDIASFTLPAKDQWFSIPDVNTPPLSIPISVSGSVDVTIPLEFSLLDNGLELDSLFCSGLPITIAFSGLPSLELVEITFPQILVNGQTYTVPVVTNAVPAIHSIIVPPCKIVPKDKKRLDMQVRIKGQIPAPVNANLNVKIQNILDHYTGAFGYFGQESSPITDSIELNIMEDLHITADQLNFDTLKIAANIRNSMGIPFRLTLNTIKAYGKNGQPIIEKPLSGKNIEVLAPSSADIGREAITNDTIRCEGFGDVLNKETKKIVFSFTVISNPKGTERNFLTTAGAIESAVGIRIPLHLQAQRLELKDTIDVNMSSVSLQDLELKMLFKNSLPAKTTLNVVLLDENNNPSSNLIKDLVIESPTLDNTGSATGETVYNQPLEIAPELLNQLKTATRAIATVEVDTGTGYVTFKKNNNLNIKIGAKATFTYDDLLK